MIYFVLKFNVKKLHKKSLTLFSNHNMFFFTLTLKKFTHDVKLSLFKTDFLLLYLLSLMIKRFDIFEILIYILVCKISLELPMTIYY